MSNAERFVSQEAVEEVVMVGVLPSTLAHTATSTFIEYK